MELTCWWNQLWIIFMNMKSITAAASNPSTLFISLWEWEMKWSWWNCCFAAQPLIKKLVFYWRLVGERARNESNELKEVKLIDEMKERVRPAAQFNLWMNQSLLALSSLPAAVMGGWPPRAPPKGRQAARERDWWMKQMNEAEREEKVAQQRQLFFNETK